ncbi:MAG: hypothetical protein J5I50_13360 [Chitinophagaceae bacterium]|nr:hypothetical protein [Chitinophagaceae bacterium]
MLRYLILTGFLISISACSNNREAGNSFIDTPDNEVIYHVVQRSFYDSNGDLHGDLNGLYEKLGYLQDLGVTSILMLPLYASPFYHNYFADNFEEIDPRFGTKDDYLRLVKEIHRRGMKIYMDMETQYVTEDHLWYKDSYGNPASPYSDYIAYDDSAQTKPSTIVYDLDGLKGYNGVFKKITTVNLNSEKVKEYNLKLFSYWLDPDGDGDFSDGVDGFRLDHMMDDLDKKGRWINLFETFWKPLIKKLKAINPKIRIIAEQANWASFGEDYLTRADVDWVFAFRIAFAVRDMNKEQLSLMIDSTFLLTPKGKNQIVFIENHDMARFATVVKENPGKLRIGAALNLLIGGIPSVYYGQEIGMRGEGAFMKWGMTDANEIPEREAFEWYASDTGKGMAFWYKDTGPWWDSSLVKPNNGISYEEQKDNPESLWNYYKNMIHLRRTHATLVDGTYMELPNNQDSVFSFIRKTDNKAAIILSNLSGNALETVFDISGIPLKGNPVLLSGDLLPETPGNEWKIQLPPYAVLVYEADLKN